MNKYKVYISTEAEHDLADIYLYINSELNNQTAAIRLKDKIKESILSLSTMPMRNTFVRDDRLASLKIRMMQVNNHSVFYRVNEKNNSIEIARVLYSKRDWSSLL